MEPKTTTGEVTCAKPGCGTTTAPDESYYIDGCGPVCRTCFGPVEDDYREPPF